MNMQFSVWLRALALAIFSLGLVACGSEDTLSGTADAGDETPTDPTDPRDPVDTTTLRMGVLDQANGNFIQNVIAVEQSPIADGVGTTVRVDIVDETGALYTADSVSVSFTAACADADAFPRTRSTGATGSASTVYTGTVPCIGEDTLTATATFGEQTLSATGVVEVRAVRMGVLDGGTFTEGRVHVGQDPIATRGSSDLRVDLVDESGALFTLDNFEVAFTSSVCGGSSELDSPVTSVNGVARSTFQDAGCASGAQTTDTITATASAYGKALSATGTLTIEPANIGALEFDSATPTVIGLRGTGGQGIQETSTVTFVLRDDVGDPVEGETVRFTLDRTSGGVELSDSQGISNSEGKVSVVVRSGTVHTTVRVRAEATAPNSVDTIFSQSDQLVISSGITDNDSFSLTASCFNLEAFDYDGVEAEVNIRLADRFNNPVPEGTAVAFTAEAGSIDSECFVDATGACSVVWRSQGERPIDGRSTILAFAEGEESFFDANGNGVHNCNDADGDGSPEVSSDGECLNGAEQDLSGDSSQNRAPQDLGEAYLDRDEDGVFDSIGFAGNGRQTENRTFTEIASDSLQDFDGDGIFDPPSGAFTGLLCESGCDASGPSLIHVRDSLVLIFSGSGAFLDDQFIADQDGVNDSFLDDPSTNTPVDSSGYDTTMNLGLPPGSTDAADFVGGASIGLVLRDERGQPLPVGTTISVETDVGTAVGVTSREVLCSTNDSMAANRYFFSIDAPAPDAEADSGSLRITVTTPRGVITEYSYGVTFNPVPEGP